MNPPHKIWIEQCEAARAIENEFGMPKALEYLIGEKFIDFLDAAEDDSDFRSEIPAFVAEIKSIFEPWQLAVYLEKARQTEPFDPSVYDDPDEAELAQRLEIRKGEGVVVGRVKVCRASKKIYLDIIPATLLRSPLSVRLSEITDGTQERPRLIEEWT